MSSTTPDTSVRIVPLDLGAAAILVRGDDGGRVLAVRPYPEQSFDSASQATAAALQCSQDEARALLRHYFPTDAILDLPVAGAPEGARRIRDEVRRRQSRLTRTQFAIIAAVAVAAGFAVSWFPLQSELAPPLHRPEVAQALDVWGLVCENNDGWVAACNASVSGSFLLRGGFFEDKVFLSSAAGHDVVNMYLIADDAEAEDTYRRMRGMTTLADGPPGSSVVWLRGNPNLIMWGSPNLVPDLTNKGVSLGWDLADAPGPGPTHSENPAPVDVNS